jgi:hypothetical protein
LPDGKTNVGFIAEEVYNVDPMLSVINDDGCPCNVSWTYMVTYLINEIKKLKTQITTLQSQISNPT